MRPGPSGGVHTWSNDNKQSQSQIIKNGLDCALNTEESMDIDGTKFGRVTFENPQV